jgi:chorismate mutase
MISLVNELEARLQKLRADRDAIDGLTLQDLHKRNALNIKIASVKARIDAQRYGGKDFAHDYHHYTINKDLI